MPAHHRVRRDPEDFDRQGAEIRATRAGEAARPQPGVKPTRDDAWPRHCRVLLVGSATAAARQFPGRGEQAPERVHGVRKTLKEARAIARLFLPSLGEPARVTIAALAVVRRRVGRARDLDVMEARLARLAPPPEIAAPLVEAIGRERAAASRGHGGFASRAPTGRRAGAEGSLSTATTRRRCTRCARAWSTCVISSRRSLPPGRRRSTPSLRS